MCEVRRAAEACDPAERRLAEWAHLDVTSPRAFDPTFGDGLLLIVRAPPPRTLTCQIALHFDRTLVATVTLSICIPCGATTRDYVHVAAGYRLLGYGRTLVAAALARARITGGLLHCPTGHWPSRSGRASPWAALDHRLGGWCQTGVLGVDRGSE